jgi:hypothetical protein
MSHPRRKTPQTATEIVQDAIVIDATVQEAEALPRKVFGICWNTGEEKNCPACYLSEGCKARE